MGKRKKKKRAKDNQALHKIHTPTRMTRLKTKTNQVLVECRGANALKH